MCTKMYIFNGLYKYCRKSQALEFWNVIFKYFIYLKDQKYSSIRAYVIINFIKYHTGLYRYWIIEIVIAG